MKKTRCKAVRTTVPNESVAVRYMPADHTDAYKSSVICDSDMSAAQIMTDFWTRMPRPVEMMFSLRDAIVRPFGLEGGQNKDKDDFRRQLEEGVDSGIISFPHRDERETVMQLEDKHLTAWLSVYVPPCENIRKEVFVITVVKYNNRFGMLYFNVIRPFHHVIVKTITRRTLQKLYTLR